MTKLPKKRIRRKRSNNHAAAIIVCLFLCVLLGRGGYVLYESSRIECGNLMGSDDLWCPTAGRTAKNIGAWKHLYHR
jgi:hypothetical protein